MSLKSDLFKVEEKKRVFNIEPKDKRNFDPWTGVKEVGPNLASRRDDRPVDVKPVTLSPARRNSLWLWRLKQIHAHTHMHIYIYIYYKRPVSS